MLKNKWNGKCLEIVKFMAMLVVFSFAVFITNYQYVIRSYNSTMLALSYKYGFTSRALLGTIYHLVNRILPVDMLDYAMAMRFAQVVTALFFLFLLVFAYVCLKFCEEKYMKPCEYLILFFMLFAVSMFSGGYNFFRVDMFMVAVSMICALLIVCEKAEWLVVPLSAIGVMFHQGYVFMFLNIVLVLLAYKFLSKDKKVKYGILFFLTFTISSALFLWFELFSRSDGALYFDTIADEARRLSENGYHTTLLMHEVLGIDLGAAEESLRKINIVQFPIFTLLFLPYIMIAAKFFYRLIINAKTKVEKWKYVIVLIGAGTMLPDFILKLDYGRWIFAVMTYYSVVILALCMMKDKNVGEEVAYSFQRISSKPWMFLLLLIPILFIPFWDVDINGFVQHVGIWIDSHFLNWYEFQ